MISKMDTGYHISFVPVSSSLKTQILTTSFFRNIIKKNKANIPGFLYIVRSTILSKHVLFECL